MFQGRLKEFRGVPEISGAFHGSPRGFQESTRRSHGRFRWSNRVSEGTLKISEAFQEVLRSTKESNGVYQEEGVSGAIQRSPVAFQGVP